MTLVVRTAAPSDDLAVLWPGLAKMKLNLEQVIVAVDADEEDRILGGILAWDGGHEMVYVGELTLIATTRRRLVAKKLVANLLVWLRVRGALAAVFTCFDVHFSALCLKAGARVIGQPMMLVLRLGDKT